MRVNASDPSSVGYVVYMNGRLCPAALAADDIEGWIEVVDVSKLAPLDLEAETAEEDIKEEAAYSIPTVIATKKIYGKVEIRKVK